jgi:parvulin-like peptidyl-prolyl isomerase
MNFSRAVLAGLLLVMAVSLVSCSSREDVVLAEFRDESVTVGQFEKAYRTVQPKYLPKATGVEGYREFLNTMLNKEIMAFKADELGYDRDPGVVEGMEAYKGSALQLAFLKFRIDDMNKVTDEQVREHYRNRGAQVSIKQMLLDTPEEAEEAYQILMDGADFESVCREYSKGPDAEQGGRVLDVTYGNYAPYMQQKIFGQPIGGITEPIMSQYGFFIIKVVGRADSKNQEPFEEIRETLEQEVRVQNEMLLQTVVNDEIAEEANLTWYWENLRIAYQALPPDRPLTNAPDRRNEVYPLLYFEQGDLDKPIASYKEKMVTIRDFSDYYDQTSFYQRPRQEGRMGGVKLFLGHYITKELMAEAVARSDIADRREVREAMESKLEELMVSRLYEDMINSQTIVTNTMVNNYYRNNREAFRMPEKRRFGVILTGDLETAREAYDRVKSGKRFHKVAMEYSIDKPTLDNLAETDLLVKGRQPEMDEVGFSLARVGAVSEPFETPKGWMILKLKEKTEATIIGMEQARDSIERALKQEENEKRLNELLAKWKEEVGLVVHEDNLGKIQVEQRSITDKA